MWIHPCEWSRIFLLSSFASQFVLPASEITFTIHLALSARSATPLAEAVPGNEGDYPCNICEPVIRNQSKGLASGAGMVGA